MPGDDDATAKSKRKPGKRNGKSTKKLKRKRTSVTDVELSNGHWEKVGLMWDYVVTVTAVVSPPSDPTGATWVLAAGGVKAKLEKRPSGSWVTAIPLQTMTPDGTGGYETTLRGPESAVGQSMTVQGVVIAEWCCTSFAQSEDSDDISTGTHGA